MSLFEPDSPKPRRKKTKNFDKPEHNPNQQNPSNPDRERKQQFEQTGDNPKNNQRRGYRSRNQEKNEKRSSIDAKGEEEKMEEKREELPSEPIQKKSGTEKLTNSNSLNPRRRRKKTKKQKDAEVTKPQTKQQITIPLMIKTNANRLSNEQFQQPLEDFVQKIYSENEGKQENKVITSFQRQDDEGNIEYKLKLINPSADRLEHLATQMKFRIRQGQGQAFYRIGVQDNGRPRGLSQQDMFDSLKTICKLAHKIHTQVTVIRISQGINGLIAELMVRKTFRQGVKLEIRLLLFGEVGSGKSTLLSVLKSGEKDDGKGYCRSMVFTHKHEMMSGTTMTKSHHVIGFDSEGMVYSHNSMLSSETWLDNASKVLSFIDVGGHKKAQKQLVSSICSFFPEYGLWVLSAKSKFSAESNNVYNLELAKIFNIPLIVVITHMDLVDKQEEMETIYQTKKALKALYPDNTPCIVKEMEHAVLFSRITSTEDVIPIFLLSNVTGQNIDLLTNFFNLLPSTSELRNNQDLHSEFLIADKYIVDGRIVLAGTVIKGNIKAGQILHLGPDMKGTFRAIEIVSIQCMRVPVKLAKCGQICTIAMRPLTYAKQWLEKEPNAIRRGMVLIESKSNPKAAYEFLVELTTYGKEEVTITTKYQPVVNTLTTRQICKIVTFPNQKDQIFVPKLIISKKSKSIDSIKKRNSLRDRSSGNINSNSQSKPSLTYYKSKQSVDLTSATDITIQGEKVEEIAEKKEKKSIELSPIAEKEANKVKKKREKEEIKFNDKQGTLVRLRFMYAPEYITVGQRIVVNQLKLIGKVKEIFY